MTKRSDPPPPRAADDPSPSDGKTEAGATSGAAPRGSGWPTMPSAQAPSPRERSVDVSVHQGKKPAASNTSTPTLASEGTPALDPARSRLERGPTVAADSLPDPQVAFGAAQRWVEGDPDPETRAELQQLIEANAFLEVAERMHGTLEFGTAGLRGVVGAGSARMNRAVVIRATRGLADHLLKQPDARTMPVVVGRDARLSSERFMADVVGVLVAAGIPVRYFPEPVPTPMVGYAARQLSAMAAVCVTASHNPPEYNGYKVFGPDAAQIAPPLDTQIAARIDAVGPANTVPIAEKPFEHPKAEALPADLFERYLMELGSLRPAGPADRDITIAYTPLHGVGWRYAERALRHAGYRKLEPVAEQREPDGTFPTVRFPNPEEDGALDLAKQLAARVDADVLLANDPDADRLAVCLPSVSGRWLALSGNQVGLLLADFVLQHAPRPPAPLVVSTVVSSPMLRDIAQAHGARVEQTLTGFKWIYAAARELERPGGVRFAFGYEEALGYGLANLVRDKDGISAAVLFADLVARAKAEGQTVFERLERLYRQHGLWVSVQHSVVRPGAEGMAEISRAVDSLANSIPHEIAGRRVIGSTDYRVGAEQRPPWRGTALLVALDFEGGRVLVRPSGTEPKLKIYVDLRVDVKKDDSVRALENDARSAAERIATSVATLVGLDA